MNNWILSTQTEQRGKEISREISRSTPVDSLNQSSLFEPCQAIGHAHGPFKGCWCLSTYNRSFTCGSFQFLGLAPALRVYGDNFCVWMWWKDLQYHISYISLQPNRPCKNILFLWEAKNVRVDGEEGIIWLLFSKVCVFTLHCSNVC